MKKLKKTLVIIGLTLLIIFVGYFVITPIIFGFIATRSAQSGVEEPPEGFNNIKILTVDNLELSAWYKKPSGDSKAAIILVHGAGGSRESVKEHIDIFNNTDYGILAFDARGHGESEGKTNKFCWECGNDINAAITYAKEQNIQKIGALGLSMGAETILGAVGSSPDIQAVVSDGATHRFYKEFRELPKYSGLLGLFTPVLMTDYATRIFSNEKPPITIAESITSSTSSFLFIAAGNVADEIEFNSFYNELTEPKSTLYIVDNCGHTEGIDCEREIYSSQILRFFEENLRK